jgi:hypothetical protein
MRVNFKRSYKTTAELPEGHFGKVTVVLAVPPAFLSGILTPGGRLLNKVVVRVVLRLVLTTSTTVA